MNLRKKCPSCGALCSEVEIFCPGCGAEISGIKAGHLPEFATPRDDPEAGGVSKVCPKCGAKSELYALLCTQPGCGTALEPDDSASSEPPGSHPALATKSNNLPDLTVCEVRARKLLLIVGSSAFECKSGDVLGRSGTLACNLFSGIPTVSAQHVALECQGGQWRVINLPLQAGKAAKNITVLDGRELEIGASASLTGEHVLKISTRCEVKFRVV